jgi:hypothetical protein
MRRYKFGISKGSIPLSLYVFVGLITIDPSWVRTITSLIAAMILLFWGSRNIISDEDESESWRWSRATSRAISAMSVLCVGAMVPFAIRWLRQPPSGQQVVQDAVSMVGYLIFSFLFGVVIYLMLLLRPIMGSKDSDLEMQALKLEHQSCLAIFQTGGTCMVVIFLGALLTPVLGTSVGTSDITIARLGWAFYCFAGGIVWFLRPCLARAKHIRRELQLLRRDSVPDVSTGTSG